MEKSTHWFYKLPGSVAGGPVNNWNEPIDEAEFREWLRGWLGIKRLPRNTEVWPTTVESIKPIEDNNREIHKDVLAANPHLCLSDFM